MFDVREAAACSRLIELALIEDLGAAGDVTSRTTIPADRLGHAALVARTAGVLAGLDAAAQVFRAVDPAVAFIGMRDDGAAIGSGDVLARVQGPMRSILAAERTALNFLQHLSGIATVTRAYVNAVRGTRARILDTRKTLPGWRLLAKYAVRCGSGHNHRAGLYDGILIKDNHLAAVVAEDGAVRHAITAARAAAPAGMIVVIEVDTLAQLDEALPAGPDIVLLDNMSLDTLREAVRRRSAVAPSVLLEASGGVSLQTVGAIAATGVDRISVGALTHSAAALDIGLDYEETYGGGGMTRV